MFLSLLVKTKNFNSLNKFLFFITKTFVYQKFKMSFFIKCINKKTNYINYSILQSPHVNKKSGEQFEFRIFCKQFYVYSFETKKILFLLKNKIEKIFPDILLEIKLLMGFFIFKKLQKNVFNPNIFFCNKKKNIKFLKILDIYGEKCFISKLCLFR